MRVLLSAYACAPDTGSEGGFGWGWATHLAAQGLEVHVLTSLSNKAAIETAVLNGEFKGLTFSFVRPWIRGLREWNGAHYFAWQCAAVPKAKQLHRAQTFDIVHHVTYGSIHVPSQLGSLGLPLIFGPIGGGQITPPGLAEYLGESRWKEWCRTAFTRFLPFSALHRYWMRKMSLVLATNHETADLARRMGAREVRLYLDSGLPDSFVAPGPRCSSSTLVPLRLIWVGRFLRRKALPLALDALAQVNVPVELTVVGHGIEPDSFWEMVKDRGLDGKVFWQEKGIPWAEVREAYRTHDALLFTSIRESFGSQQLEAMAAGLPIINLDLHGSRAFVPVDAKFTVPVSDKASTILALASAIKSFAAASIEKRSAMSNAAWMSGCQNTWTERAKQIAGIYVQLLEERMRAGVD